MRANIFVAFLEMFFCRSLSTRVRIYYSKRHPMRQSQELVAPVCCRWIRDDASPPRSPNNVTEPRCSASLEARKEEARFSVCISIVLVSPSNGSKLAANEYRMYATVPSPPRPVSCRLTPKPDFFFCFVLPLPPLFISSFIHCSHLEVMLTEQLKNACRAVVQRHHPAYT